MLFFKNLEKGTTFFVDTVHNKVLFCTIKEYLVFRKFKDCFNGIEYLSLPNLKTVHKFRKIVKTGVVHGMNEQQAKAYLIDQYPELFI